MILLVAIGFVPPPIYECNQAPDSQLRTESCILEVCKSVVSASGVPQSSCGMLEIPASLECDERISRSVLVVTSHIVKVAAKDGRKSVAGKVCWIVSSPPEVLVYAWIGLPHRV